MLSPLRNRFGIPGVISVIALVFAMFGGAYAATNSSEGDTATASAKAKQGPRGPRGKTGKTGPAGPAGPQGPAGAKGDTGAAGSNGTNGKDGVDGADGADGKSVVTGTATLTECPEVGGSTVEVAGEPLTKKKVCNGKNGTTGFTATLPPEATETGVWRFLSNGESNQYVPISFPIPLSTADAAAISVQTEKEGSSNPECPGTEMDPQAEPGVLCIYIAVGEEGKGTAGTSGPPTGGVVEPDFAGQGVGPSGAFLYYEEVGLVGAHASGSFAITAPSP